ncbi:MAG: hypothetical protein AAB501_03675 [Patescibacteria group bacterium]
MEILKVFRRLRKKKVTFREGFNLLLEKFSLVDKVGLCNYWNPPKHTFTIFRFVEEGEDRNVPLPVEFIWEIKSWIHRCYGERIRSILGVYPDVEVVSAKTKAEFEKMIKDWEDYCAMRNSD